MTSQPNAGEPSPVVLRRDLAARVHDDLTIEHPGKRIHDADARPRIYAEIIAHPELYMTDSADKLTDAALESLKQARKPSSYTCDGHDFYFLNETLLLFGNGTSIQYGETDEHDFNDWLVYYTGHVRRQQQAENALIAFATALAAVRFEYPDLPPMEAQALAAQRVEDGGRKPLRRVK